MEKEERPSPAFYIIGSLIIFYILTQMVSCEMYWLEVGKNGTR